MKKLLLLIVFCLSCSENPNSSTNTETNITGTWHGIAKFNQGFNDSLYLTIVITKDSNTILTGYSQADMIIAKDTLHYKLNLYASRHYQRFKDRFTDEKEVQLICRNIKNDSAYYYAGNLSFPSENIINGTFTLQGTGKTSFIILNRLK